MLIVAKITAATLTTSVRKVAVLLAAMPALALSWSNPAAADIRMLSEPLEQHHTIEDMIGERANRRGLPDQMLPLPPVNAGEGRKAMLGHFCRTNRGTIGPGASGPVGSPCVGNGNYGRIVRMPD